MLNEVYVGTSIKDSLRRVTRSLRTVVDNMGTTVLSDLSNKPIVHTRLQALFNLKFDNVLDRRLYEIMITHAVHAEKIGPGAFDRCIRMTLDYLELYEKGFPPSNFVNYDIKPITTGNHPVRQDIMRIIDSYTIDNEVVKDLIMCAVELAGFGGRIIVEKTNSTVHSVELSRGYTFDISPVIPVTVKFDQPRIICIDGYIESVSEIHHLLETASEIKEPGLMFVRGLSDDVIHTLKTNYDRGSLKIVPVIVKFDLEGINMINDIAIVTGADLVSSTKGDLITSVRFNEAPRIDAAVIYPAKVVITNSSTHKAVSTQVSFLMNKRNEETVVSDVGTLYDKRIKSLSPNQVTIRIPDTKDYVVSAQTIDYVLRAIRSAVDYGVDESGLVASTIVARIHSQRCIETLTSIGAMVTS